MTTRPSGADHWSKREPDRVLRGSDAPGAKLSPEEITAMCAAFNRGARPGWLAKKYGVSRITVWRHVKAKAKGV